jgi:hypothetical protein
MNKDDTEHMVGFLGRGLTAARVSVLGPKSVSVVTDKLGHYEAPNLPPGKYEVSIDVPFGTYPAKSQTVDLVERGCAEVNFHVDPSSKQSESLTTLTWQGISNMTHRITESKPSAFNCIEESNAGFECELRR